MTPHFSIIAAHFRPLIAHCALLLLILGFSIAPGILPGQTTQAALAGQIQDSVDGRLIQGASVEAENRQTGVTRKAVSGVDGEFAILSLSPGTYLLRVSAVGYQTQQLDEYEVRIASRTRQPFSLRPLSDVWETRERRNLQSLSGRVLLPMVGPDLGAGYDISLATSSLSSEALIPALSAVASRNQLRDLPLAGRDTYTLLIGLGGINSDTGSGRGLGFTVAGQRPSSSAFRLDGFENDNRLTTGPSVSLAPEAIEEFRVSQAHFAAEYGGTNGYLANAVSREAGRQWHGIVYGYGRNAGLNANGFARNRVGTSRPGSRELQPGFFFGGPLFRERGGITLFAEHLGNRSQQDPALFELPSTNYRAYTESRSLARSLLDRFRAPLPNSTLPSAIVSLRPDSRLSRTYAMLRTDQRLGREKFRLFERVILNRADRPDFLWTPYPDFLTPLRQDNVSAGISLTWVPRADLAHEFRLAFGQDKLGWDRPYPNIPTLTAFNFRSTAATVLPGSPAAYSYHDHNVRWESGYNITILRDLHQWKLGGQVLFRRTAGALTFGRDGRYVFPDIFNFFVDWPVQLDVAVGRGNPSPQAPPYDSHFGSREWAGFAQDEWRLTPNLTLTGGVRYEFFGPPAMQGGTQLLAIRLGQGDSIDQAVAGASIQSLPGGSPAYTSDRNNLAVRAGLSYKFSGGGPVLRASYGTFYDRPFDNLWQSLRTNSIQLESAPLTTIPFDYLRPVRDVLGAQRGRERADFPEMLLYQPGIRDPYVHSYMVGLSSTWHESWQWEVSHLGSLGRKLITSDRVNRPDSVGASANNPLGRLNRQLGTFAYRANQGSSSFAGMNLALRRRSESWMFEANYTWSHAIDNQSDPLAGDFLDLSFTGGAQADASRSSAAFSRQFDSNGDRGNSDFDQRHNLVVIGSWQPRAVGSQRWRSVTSGWRVSWLTAIRGGLPFTVFAPGGTGPGAQLYNRRADYNGGSPRSDVPLAGGVQWLSPGAFAIPKANLQGNLGRNSLRAPGFYSADVSLARTFSATEYLRVTFRVDAFNVLNHTGLDAPQNVVGLEDFGVASYGRRGRRSAFPASSPLDESPRQLQLGLRLEF